MRALNRVLLSSLLALAAFSPPSAEAQTLRGSRTSVERMYQQARDHDLPFYRTSANVRKALSDGDLVRLPGNADYQLNDVNYPYALPSTRTFVERLASQYRDACGERLVVTSATRPRSLRLVNGAGDRSVHPAGMAVDLRKPTRGRCLSWLRDTLLAIEGTGAINATEERFPPHFHIAVYPGPYRRYVESMGGDVPTLAAREEAKEAERSYRVRRGDSLWGIARRHGTSVARLKSANDMRSSRIVAGQTLIIPSSR